MLFKVAITETLELTVEVEADDPQAAEKIVSDCWRNSEYVLGADNFISVEFTYKDDLQNDEPTIIWGKYLQYLRDWAGSHSEPGFYGTTPACFDEWLECEYQEEQK